MALYARSSGSAAAPTIVFLHGGGVSGWVWAPVAARLPEYHCLLPDLPEHGQSVAAGPFSIQGAARDVATLIRERAHGGRAHVVGLSIGSQAALELIGTAPELVDRAVLSGILVPPPAPQARRRGRTVLDLLNALFQVLIPIRGNALLVRAILRLSRIPQRYFRPYREDARLATVAGLMRVVTENVTYRAPDTLDTATMPTLVVVGQDEPPALHESARRLLTFLPCASGRVVPGVAHNWNLEAPDRFATVVRAWVEDRPPDGLIPLA